MAASPVRLAIKLSILPSRKWGASQDTQPGFQPSLLPALLLHGIVGDAGVYAGGGLTEGETPCCIFCEVVAYAVAGL